MRYKYDDGGRKDSGFKGTSNDCVVRAIAIATCQSYRRVRNEIIELQNEMTSGFDKGISRGVYQPVYHKYLADRGWSSYATPKNTYLKDIPDHGIYIVTTSGHVMTVWDGVVLDSWDSRHSRRTKCGSPKVVGYHTNQ